MTDLRFFLSRTEIVTAAFSYVGVSMKSVKMWEVLRRVSDTW